MAEYVAGGAGDPVGGGGGLEEIDDEYAFLDSTGVVTASQTGMTVTGTLSNILNETINNVFVNNKALDGSEKWQFDFADTVTLFQVVVEQSGSTNEGIWVLETLSGGIWTAMASTVQMGLAPKVVYQIDEARRANCDGVRFVGSSGSITNIPWRQRFRFLVTKAP